jgi:TolB-like protein/DNA-binding SARP family transcriptional activator
MTTDSASDSEGQARWSFRLFGGFELSQLPAGEKVAGLGKRERVLLAYLALSPKGREQRRKLTTLLWGDAADETTLENLRSCLYGLRKTLGDSEHRVIASGGEDIVLDAAAFEVDALTFRRLAAQSGRAELEEAAKLYSGGLLDGLDIDSEEFQSWRREDAMRFKDQAIDVLARLMAQRAESGEIEQAIDAGRRILRLEPLHESAVRRLMRLYADSERRPTAIQLYRTLSDALKLDLGAQPEAETRAVFAEISRGGEETPAPATTDAKAGFPPTTSDSLSWPPKAGHPGDEGLLWRMDTRQLDGPVERGHDKWSAVSRSRWILAGGLAATIGLFLLLQFDRSSDSPIAEQQTGVEVAKVAASSALSAVSLAVLPFVNLSGDPNQEFFSDGMTEEITTALGKVPDLRVVARTSAYQFKGQNRDVQSIGQQLRATHLIEGSVRKAGERLRITAQLIDANDGTQLWSETYDRELNDIFAIQEDIARAIAASLRTPLGLRPGENLVNNRSIDPDSYEQFLRAKATQRRGRGAAADMIAILEPLVARNPDYAPAWAKLAHAYFFAVTDGRVALSEAARRVRETNVARMETAARRAVALDPNSVEGNMFQAIFQMGPRKWALIEDALSKALTLDPNSPEVLVYYSTYVLMLGRIKEALAVQQKLRELEPFRPRNLAQALWLDGQTEAAIAISKDDLGPGGRVDLSRIYASLGRYQEAADVLSQARGGQQYLVLLPAAVPLLRSAPAKAPSPETLPRLARLDFIYLYIGAPERALDFFFEEYPDPIDISVLWHPTYATVRKMERFKTLVRQLGLIDYWRERGWPSFCRPTTGDDFVCE